jgi:hypothetical protein
MAGDSAPFGGLQPGDDLGELRLAVSPAANERYWRNAGVDHPLLAAGALYPPIAANLTILLLQTRAPGTMIQTRQRIDTHALLAAGSELIVTGAVGERFIRKGREYVTVNCAVSLADTPDAVAWHSVATFFEQSAGRGA